MRAGIHFTGILSLFLLVAVPTLADIVHLRNGQQLSVRSWRYEQGNLVLETALGGISIPRSLVSRVEITQVTAGTATTEGRQEEMNAGENIPQVSPSIPEKQIHGPEVASSETPEISRQVVELKRQLGAHPESRSALVPQIAVRLAMLGARALQDQDLFRAEQRFRESLNYQNELKEARLGLAQTYLSQGKLAYAKNEALSALVRAPDDATLHTLLGEVYYREEDLLGAIQEWRRSLSLQEDPRVRARLEKARRESAVDREYRRTESAHFTIRHQGTQRVEAAVRSSILDFLEAQYGVLRDHFRDEPPDALVVLLHPVEDFHRATEAPHSVGGLFDGKIRVPIAGEGRLTPRAQAVLVHELTHAFVHFQSRGRCPRWLHEGLAQLMEDKTILPSEKKSLVQEFVNSSGGVWCSKFTYPSSLSFTRYLSKRFEFETLVETLERVGSGLSIEDALAQTTHESFSELQEACGHSLLQDNVERL